MDAMKYILILAGTLAAGFLFVLTLRVSGIRQSLLETIAKPPLLLQQHSFGCDFVSPPRRILPYTPSSSFLVSFKTMLFRYEEGLCNGLFVPNVVLRQSVPQPTPVAPPRVFSAASSSEQRTNFAFPSPKQEVKTSSAPRMPPVLPELFLVPPPPPPKIIPAPAFSAGSSSSEVLAATAPPTVTPPPPPPLDEQAILRAVVKIECPSKDGKGRYIGSGFAVSNGIIVTAAHLIQNSGSEECRVIFPHKRVPSHYLTGRTEDRAAVRIRHDEEGIDVATLTLPPLTEYPEAQAIFPDAYPSIPYPVCEDPDMIGNALMHFGYPSNFLNQSYLSKSDGEAIAYADIQGIETRFTRDQTAAYQSPIFSYSAAAEKHRLHPYMISRVPTFYGDSGGLAFNATKQCILGPHRGGTIGGGAGENISIFPLLGWPPAKALLP